MSLTPLNGVSKPVKSMFQAEQTFFLFKSASFCWSFAYYFFSILQIFIDRFLVKQ